MIQVGVHKTLTLQRDSFGGESLVLVVVPDQHAAWQIQRCLRVVVKGGEKVDRGEDTQREKVDLEGNLVSDREKEEAETRGDPRRRGMSMSGGGTKYGGSL